MVSTPAGNTHFHGPIETGRRISVLPSAGGSPAEFVRDVNGTEKMVGRRRGQGHQLFCQVMQVFGNVSSAEVHPGATVTTEERFLRHWCVMLQQFSAWQAAQK